MTAPVASLPAKWRENADRASAESASKSLIPEAVCELRAEATTFRMCADSLEAALASPAGEGADLDAAAVEAGHITWRSMQQCADAWLAVNNLLHELAPDWTNNSLTGREAALEAIRRLATPAGSVQGGVIRQCADDLDTGIDIRIVAAQLRALAATPPPAPAAEQGEMSPEFTDSARAALAWVLYHHQGGSSAVGQAIRFALGMGAHERLPDWRIAEAKAWAERVGAKTADFHATQPETRGVEGMVLVPREPTTAMTNAYHEAQKAAVMASDMAWGISNPAQTFAAGYRAMLAAAPAAPGAVGVDATRYRIFRDWWFKYWTLVNYEDEVSSATTSDELDAAIDALAGKDGAK